MREVRSVDAANFSSASLTSGRFEVEITQGCRLRIRSCRFHADAAPATWALKIVDSDNVSNAVVLLQGTTETDWDAGEFTIPPASDNLCVLTLETTGLGAGTKAWWTIDYDAEPCGAMKATVQT